MEGFTASIERSASSHGSRYGFVFELSLKALDEEALSRAALAIDNHEKLLFLPKNSSGGNSKSPFLLFV